MTAFLCRRMPDLTHVGVANTMGIPNNTTTRLPLNRREDVKHKRTDCRCGWCARCFSRSKARQEACRNSNQNTEGHASGLIAASQTNRRRTKRKPPEPQFIQQVEQWLKGHSPSAGNLKITTERIARDIANEEFEANARGVEMRIAGALRALDMRSRRIMVNGKRRYRWFPTKIT